jgi:DNA ligase-1
MFDTIYKRTSAGKIQQWAIEVKGNKYRTISGQTNGKKTTSAWTKCFGKNTGKTNATTDNEQALKEAEAVFTKKLENHYRRDIKKINEDKFVKAMLAHKFEQYPDLDYSNTYSQPKLDGIRCLVTKDGMFSRGGKPIISAPHIFKALKELFKEDSSLIFDGELYTDALKGDFNKIVSLAKRSKPTDADLAESKEHLQYWIYDIASSQDVFNDRIEALRVLEARWDWANLLLLEASIDLSELDCLVLVPTDKVESKEHLDELYQGYLANGMEGQMIRKSDSLYEGKRSKNLLKRKEFQDAEFTITSVNEGVGNWAGYAKSVSYTTKDGLAFDAGIKGTQEYCKELLGKADKMVGKQATVRYQNLTPDGIPRFGVTYHIWDNIKI